MGAIASLFAPKPPKVEPPPAIIDQGQVAEARRRQLRLAAGRRGRESSILTGGQGAAGEAPLARKSLLGV